MRRAHIGLCLAWALAASAAPALQAEAPRTLTSPPDRRVELDFQHYYTAAQLGLGLRQLAEAYPEFVAVESIGRSRGGQELWVVSAASASGPPASDRPGIFIAGSLGRGDLQGAEMALYTLLELVQNHARDASIARLLQQCVFYVAPCVNPDLRGEAFDALESGAGALDWRGVELERNFPVGWDHALGAASGPYPLSEPETRALTEFLLEHPNIAVVQSYGPAPLPAAAESDPRASDASLYARVCARADGADAQALYPVGAWGERGGSLLEFASCQLGAFAFRVDAGGSADPDGLGMPRTSELALFAQRAARASLTLGHALPRLAIGPSKLQRLRNDQWQVELAVANRGDLPTLSALGIDHNAAPPPELELRGAAVVAAMLQDPGADVHRAMSHAENRVKLVHLAGGAELGVRLIVEAQPGGALDLRLSSARAGMDHLELPLE